MKVGETLSGQAASISEPGAVISGFNTTGQLLDVGYLTRRAS
ncbi:hypothetical protein HanXRQr2_Chr02g0055571 [Helianthus annuus]|uniref:Uncharacterized protein n=1 Tax=Helianthus annuus TaxID=4232 RepID=A0A9K3JLT4_HELAN|nr:hypothetical protein HanXRQr2_Chr02g0055571 [Helianthus annuus]